MAKETTAPTPAPAAVTPPATGSYAERRGATLAAMKEAQRPGSSKPAQPVAG